MTGTPPQSSADPDEVTAPVLACFRGVHKSYDGKTKVVDDLDLDVFQGEFLTLLGPSGSGKTTTLMMLAGFEEPDAGAIELDGRSLMGVPPHRRNIGMVFQNYALFPHMTVAQNLAFPLAMRGVSRAEQERRVKEVLDVVRLPGVAERRPSQLSGGQQQRVALARAVIFEPRLVLMDEPLGALDKQLREHMQTEIRQLHKRLGITIVYVTHDQTEALVMSDRISVFADGRIQQTATPLDIYERPANAFVADFVGDNNKIAGRIVSREGRECRVECAGGLVLMAVCDEQKRDGDEVLVVFRPENVAASHPIPPRPNRLHAKLIERNYLGDHVRLLCELTDGTPITAKTSNGSALARTEPGVTVELVWSGNNCQALRHYA